MAEENQDHTLELKPRRKQPHFVLIHGMSLGSWCWYKIKCLLEVSGYTVTCIDLKSSGIDPSSADTLTSFDQYNQPLVDFLSSLPEQEQVRDTHTYNPNCIVSCIWSKLSLFCFCHQVILVGHSAGGLSVTSSIQRFPKKICLAVYIAATMLKFGFQTDEDLKDVIKRKKIISNEGNLCMTLCCFVTGSAWAIRTRWCLWARFRFRTRESSY